MPAARKTGGSGPAHTPERRRYPAPGGAAAVDETHDEVAGEIRAAAQHLASHLVRAARWPVTVVP
jgi:hypothetical protein